jgi:hypothetical protein
LTRDAEGNDLVSSNNQNILELDGKTLYAKGKNMMQNFTSPVCRFANVELQASQSAVGVLLLENPSGQQATFSDLQKQVTNKLYYKHFPHKTFQTIVLRKTNFS